MSSVIFQAPEFPFFFKERLKIGYELNFKKKQRLKNGYELSFFVQEKTAPEFFLLQLKDLGKHHLHKAHNILLVNTWAL